MRARLHWDAWLVSPFKGGQAFVEQVFDSSLEMRKPPLQLTLEHQFQIVANPDYAGIQPLLHIAHIVDRLQSERADIGQLPANSLGLGQVVPNELGKRGEVDAFSHIPSLPSAAVGRKTDAQTSAYYSSIKSSPRKPRRGWRPSKPGRSP